MNKLYKILMLTVAAATLFSCAKEVDETSESVQERILKAYVAKYYPDAIRSESGLYIINYQDGTGRQANDTSYVKVEYTITYLNGNYYSYTYDSVAKQLGTYSHGGYYDPHIWSLRTSTQGIVELLSGMHEGGYVKAIIPATLLNEESGMGITSGDGSSKIYEIRMSEVIDDIDQYQIDQLEEFAAIHYPSVQDSTAYGFYYLKTKTNTSDTLENHNTINVRYIGRFLNGTVFDTNIEDSAKKYRIYTSGNEYSALSYEFLDDSTEAMTSNDFVLGFSKALYGMTPGESAVTFFTSDYGYGDNGSSSIPGYVPLCFELWVEANENDEEE